MFLVQWRSWRGLFNGWELSFMNRLQREDYMAPMYRYTLPITSLMSNIFLFSVRTSSSLSTVFQRSPSSKLHITTPDPSLVSLLSGKLMYPYRMVVDTHVSVARRDCSHYDCRDSTLDMMGCADHSAGNKQKIKYLQAPPIQSD